MDFGNTDKKKKDSVKACPGSLSLQTVPARAYQMSLGGYSLQRSIWRFLCVIGFIFCLSLGKLLTFSD